MQDSEYMTLWDEYKSVVRRTASAEYDARSDDRAPQFKPVRAEDFRRREELYTILSAPDAHAWMQKHISAAELYEFQLNL